MATEIRALKGHRGWDLFKASIGHGTTINYNYTTINYHLAFSPLLPPFSALAKWPALSPS